MQASCEDEPGAAVVPNLPAVQVSHFWQVVAPSMVPNLPTGHASQEPASELPTALEKEPAAHLVHELSLFFSAL
jgi:hypothetical protein